jgi:hypothetical protein
MEIVKSETVKFRVPPRMLADLKGAAFDREMYVGEFLRFLIAQYLEAQEDPTSVAD